MAGEAVGSCDFDVWHIGCFRLDDGDHDLTPLLVLDANYHRMYNRRNVLDRGLDDGRTNVLSPGQDQLISPTGDDQSPLGIQMPEVAGSVRTNAWRFPDVPGRDRRTVEENLAIIERQSEPVEDPTRGPERLPFLPRFNGCNL